MTPKTYLVTFAGTMEVEAENEDAAEAKLLSELASVSTVQVQYVEEVDAD